MTCYLLSGPALEPVALDEARAFVRVDDTTEDALLTTLIATARVHVESVTGRALITQTWRLVLDCWPLDGVVALPVAPLLSLVSITGYLSGGTAVPVSSTGVTLDHSEARLLLPADFDPPVLLRERGGIEIDFVAGYGATSADVPAPLRQALLLLVAGWFENRDALASAGNGVPPAGLDLLLAPYRRVRL